MKVAQQQLKNENLEKSNSLHITFSCLVDFPVSNKMSNVDILLALSTLFFTVLKCKLTVAAQRNFLCNVLKQQRRINFRYVTSFRVN